MDNYLAELAKSRGELVKEIADTGFSYANGKEKRDELNKHIEVIDKMIDRVFAKPTNKKGSK